MFVNKNKASVGEVRMGGNWGRGAKPWPGKNRCCIIDMHLLSAEYVLYLIGRYIIENLMPCLYLCHR